MKKICSAFAERDMSLARLDISPHMRRFDMPLARLDMFACGEREGESGDLTSSPSPQSGEAETAVILNLPGGSKPPPYER